MTNSKTSSRLSRASDDSPPSEAPSIRAQSAVVRTLVDAIAHMTAAGDSADGLREQLQEELHRLEREEARLVNI
jgi:hypothetical protein